MNYYLQSKEFQKLPWLLAQDWHDLLFMHFPVSNQELLHYIPEGLELDTYEGQGWITIIPFEVKRMRVRITPPVPFLHTFLEINVRTYVKRNHVKGVYFFSLDANSFPAVFGGRVARLPYTLADITKHKRKNKISLYSRRRASASELKVTYQAHKTNFYPSKDSLDAWLLERYYLWAYRNQKLYEGVIQHEPWKISHVDVQFEMNHLLPNIAVTKIGSPLFSYAPFKSVRLWPTIKVE